MNILYLVRHGAAEEGKETLGEKGKEQMQNAIEYFKKIFSREIPVLISSIGPCAQEGAMMLGKALNIPMVTKEGLLIKEQDQFHPDLLPLSTLPAVVVSRAGFIRLAGEYFSKEFGCANPIAFDSSPDFQSKGTSFVLVCDLENRTLVKVDF